MSQDPPSRDRAEALVRRAIYRESGAKCLVDVLSDETNPEDGDHRPMRRVSLRCVESLRPSRFFGAIKEGSEWESACRVGLEGYVGWTLVYV